MEFIEEANEEGHEEGHEATVENAVKVFPASPGQALHWAACQRQERGLTSSAREVASSAGRLAASRGARAHHRPRHEGWWHIPTGNLVDS